jgi:hypothetical protein
MSWNSARKGVVFRPKEKAQRNGHNQDQTCTGATLTGETTKKFRKETMDEETMKKAVERLQKALAWCQDPRNVNAELHQLSSYLEDVFALMND